MYDFFDALITQQTSPEEAYRKFDDLANRTGDTLRKQTKHVGSLYDFFIAKLTEADFQVQEAKSSGQDAVASKLCTEYDETLTRFPNFEQK